MDNAFLFDENSTGICSDADYPYVMHKRWLRGCGSEKGECIPVEHTRVKTFEDVENTVEALMEAIAQQPISVAMYVFFGEWRRSAEFDAVVNISFLFFFFLPFGMIARLINKPFNFTNLVSFRTQLAETTWITV